MSSLMIEKIRGVSYKDRLGNEINVGDTVAILREEGDDFDDRCGEIGRVERFKSDSEGISVDVRGDVVVGFFYRENVVVVKTPSL